MTERKYLEFEEISNGILKTKLFKVVSAYDSAELGIIRWYIRWRRYVFYPTYNSLFDSACLKEITKFIDDLMDERKKK